MLKFFRETSMPRIRKERERAKEPLLSETDGGKTFDE